MPRLNAFATPGGKATQNKLHRRPTNYNHPTGTKAPAPHQYAHQGAGNGTIHDPGHGGIT